MGKGEEQPTVQDAQPEAPPGPCSILGTVASRILGVFSLRCVLVLIISFCVCLSVVFWLPPFRPFGSGNDRHDHGRWSAPIRASFNLQMPSALLADQKEMLEYQIFEEIGLPYTKVSIISMIPLAKPNWTNVVFGILPDPSNVIIPVVTLSILRSSFIGLVLRDYNLTLTPVFGKATSFEILKFPGGVTVSGQSPLLPQMNQILFNFTLNNSISQIEENLNQLKDQLKYGLKLRPYENVYVQMTNSEGSTAAPPVIVQASILSDIGSKNLLPQRLKQLAEALAGPHDRNLGLDHTVFGKVKQIQLSSYLEHSLGSPSPSPSPSPLPDPLPSPTAAPSANKHSHFVPSLSPNPSISPDMPLPPSGAYAPSLSPIPHVAPPENGPRYSFPPPLGSPAPSMVASAHSPMSSPSPAPIISQNAAPILNAPLYAPHSPPTGCRKGYPNSPHGQPRYPRRLGPNLSPSAAVPDAPSPKQNHQMGKAKTPLTLASSPMSPSPTSSLASSTYHQTLLIGLPGLVIFYLLCGFYH